MRKIKDAMRRLRTDLVKGPMRTFSSVRGGEEGKESFRLQIHNVGNKRLASFQASPGKPRPSGKPMQEGGGETKKVCFKQLEEGSSSISRERR